MTATTQCADITHHGTAANLVLLERLLNLLEHGKVTNVNTDTLAGGTERAQSVANVHIDLARVGLTGDDECGAEASLLGDKLIQLLNLTVITIEDLQERGLGARGALHATEAEVIAGTLEVAQVHQQVLNPQASTLANGDQLSRLTVSETQAREVLVLPGKLRQLVNDNGQLGDEDVETVPEQDQVSIVSAVARSSTPVNDTSSSRGDLAKGMDVGHDIVSAALLLLGGNLEFLVLDGGVSLHLLNRIFGDRKAELCNIMTMSIDFAFSLMTSDVGHSTQCLNSYLSGTPRARSTACARLRNACEARRGISSQCLISFHYINILETPRNVEPLIGRDRGKVTYSHSAS